MPCKTRQAARAGERSKPHFYLPPTTDRIFVQAQYAGGPIRRIDGFKALLAFEARIDWSTWGRSR